MTSLVTGVNAKSADPVLVTPVARATFSGATVTAPAHQQHRRQLAGHRQAGRRRAERAGPRHDSANRDLAQSTRPNGWQAYHALGTDPTHTKPRGAAVEAGFVVDLIKQANLTQLISRLR